MHRAQLLQVGRLVVHILDLDQLVRCRYAADGIGQHELAARFSRP